MISYKNTRIVPLLSSVCLLIAFVSGCSPMVPAATANATVRQTPVSSTIAKSETTPSPTQAPTPSPTPTPLQVLSIEAVADPSLAASEVKDPYSEINKYMAGIYHPDKELYNDLFHAVMNREKSFDLKGYDLTLNEKAATADCLYSESGYRLFYLNRVKMSKDGKKVTFTYSKEGSDNVKADSIEFCARLSHLLHNVMPEEYTDMQKLVSLFDYLCRTSDYAATMAEPATQTPYSILMKGQGICSGYANLMQYALSHAGLEAEYVCNEAHAWDIVKLNGNWYHTDATWGAGSYKDTLNFLNTFLMDDSKRKEGLDALGFGDQPVALGYPHADAPSPPPCTDKSFSAYNEIGCIYALDIEHSKVYFAGPNGIDEMNLDCTGRRTLTTKMQPNLMAFYNGTLYFTNSYDCFLYKMVPGQEPELLTDAEPTLYMKLEGTTLKYGADAAGKDCKGMELLPYDRNSTKNAEALPAGSIPRDQSFRISIQFSEPVAATQSWNGLVYLVDAKGRTIPLHFALSEDGAGLTVRPKDCVADCGSLSLYVTAGVASAGGAKSELSSRFDLALAEP